MADEKRLQRLFLGCFIALVATAFGFAVRGAVLGDWATQFGLTEEQKGIISGAGLYPFAISIILFSLIVDRIGYGTAMVFAFIGHITSTLLTIFAPSFEVLYVATFLYALSNGVVEAVINPVVATMFKHDKTHRLNMLHAGWPAGFVLGGLLSIAVLMAGKSGSARRSPAIFGSGRWRRCCCRWWSMVSCCLDYDFRSRSGWRRVFRIATCSRSLAGGAHTSCRFS